MTQPTPATAAFRAARDLLLRHREDHDAAVREFSWPELDEFNWALDWFDVIAAEHPGQEALRVVTEDGITSMTYGELAARSNQVANWLRSLGARRGDRLLLMLGNIAELWEVILAAIKLGVVIIPASTLLSPDDLADRIKRGQCPARGNRRGGSGRGSTGVGGNWTRIAVVPGARPSSTPVGWTDTWHRYASGMVMCRPSSPRTARPRPATRCCCTSPPAPRRSPSSSSTPRCPTRSGTCRRCTGSACTPATPT